MAYHNERHCYDPADCKFSHREVQTYIDVNPGERIPLKKKKKLPNPGKAFPKYLKDFQMHLMVACRVKSSNIFHHPKCRRRLAHPENYLAISIGDIIRQRPEMKPASTRSGCCHDQLLELFH
jgi:hypothetical protein